MSSVNGEKGVVGEERKSGLSSPPLAARTRAQKHAARVDQASSPVASRRAMNTIHVASSGPQGIIPRGPPVVKDGPAHVASSPPGSRKERKAGTSSLASSPASSPIRRSPPIIVSSADDIPKPITTPPLMPSIQKPIPTPPLMLHALTTVSRMLYSDRRSFRRSMSIVKPVARRVPVSRGLGVPSASSLTTALCNKLSSPRVLSRGVVNGSTPSELKGPPQAKGADPALPALVAVPSPEGKGPAPSPGRGNAVGTEPTATMGDEVSASSREIRDDLIGTVRSLLDGFTFADQCAVVGIHREKATRGVETAAGVGGRIVEMGAQPRQAVGVSYELPRETLSADEPVRASPPGGGAG